MAIPRVEKYIGIKDIGPSKSGLTRIYEVTNIRLAMSCGEIRWHGAWRKYCFYPADGDGKIYDSDFLELVARYLKSLNGGK